MGIYRPWLKGFGRKTIKGLLPLFNAIHQPEAFFSLLLFFYLLTFIQAYTLYISADEKKIYQRTGEIIRSYPLFTSGKTNINQDLSIYQRIKRGTPTHYHKNTFPWFLRDVKKSSTRNLVKM